MSRHKKGEREARKESGKEGVKRIVKIWIKQLFCLKKKLQTPGNGPTHIPRTSVYYTDIRECRTSCHKNFIIITSFTDSLLI